MVRVVFLHKSVISVCRPIIFDKTDFSIMYKPVNKKLPGKKK